MKSTSLLRVSGRRSRRPNQRRRGQVLLLLVLLMIIAALLGSTFVFFVSLNSRGLDQGPRRVATRGNPPKFQHNL